MPAKSTSGAAPSAAKSASTSAAKPAKSAAKPAAKAEAEPASAKTVKVSRAPGANAATVTRRAAVDPRPVLPLAERDRLIAETAYYRAESRGFAPGDDQGDWFAAAQDVDAKYRFEG